MAKPSRAERRRLRAKQSATTKGVLTSATSDITPPPAPGIPPSGASAEVPGPHLPSSVTGAAPTEGLWRFFEHPITLAALAILLGVIGLFIYTPILWACGGMFLIAFYRSKAVASRSLRVQVVAYIILAGIIAPTLYFTNHFAATREASKTTTPALTKRDLDDALRNTRQDNNHFTMTPKPLPIPKDINPAISRYTSSIMGHGTPRRPVP
jgi:hypothetical protein